MKNYNNFNFGKLFLPTIVNYESKHELMYSYITVIGKVITGNFAHNYFFNFLVHNISTKIIDQ